MSVWAGSETANAQRLPDGRRLHLQHGPIDLVIEAFGEAIEVTKAYDQAQAAFRDILPGLTAELPRLRTSSGEPPCGPIAKAMYDAAKPFDAEFITPMAAVAGSVADFVLNALRHGRTLHKAYVNNGGDIAFFVDQGTFKIGICDNPLTGTAGGTLEIGPDENIGGLATSGWRGRSFSRGIADAVTVLAQNAASADAAATIIANKVDLPGSPKVTRQRACDLSPDSDLGAMLVTTDIAPLTVEEAETAVVAGELAAREYLNRGLIEAAYIALEDVRQVVGSRSQRITAQSREAVCA